MGILDWFRDKRDRPLETPAARMRGGQRGCGHSLPRDPGSPLYRGRVCPTCGPFCFRCHPLVEGNQCPRCRQELEYATDANIR